MIFYEHRINIADEAGGKAVILSIPPKILRLFSLDKD
jgi:hypothetical protein